MWDRMGKDRRTFNSSLMMRNPVKRIHGVQDLHPRSSSSSAGMEDCSSCSFADQVLSNIDLLTEILIRLPIRSLLNFKCVCKTWSSLITNPRFSLLFHQHQNRLPNPTPISGLFLEKIFWLPNILGLKLSYDYYTLDKENQKSMSPPFKTQLNFDPDPSVYNIAILQSCNGLLLCKQIFEQYHINNNPKYYIYNPTINKYTTLPEPSCCWSSSTHLRMCLAFDPSESSHYKVLCSMSVPHLPFGEIDVDYANYGERYLDDIHGHIEIFSSETNSWRLFGQPFPCGPKTCFRDGIYSNNVVHWLATWTNRVICLKFDDEEHGICEIPGPKNGRGYLIKSGGYVLLVTREDAENLTQKMFDVFELKRDYSGWSPKYHVDVGEVIRAFPEIVSPSKYLFAILFLVVGKREEDSFVLIDIPRKVIRYNLVSKTFYKAFDLPDGPFYDLYYDEWFNSIYPFIESLSSV